jgi:hypothetical protein
MRIDGFGLSPAQLLTGNFDRINSICVDMDEMKLYQLIRSNFPVSVSWTWRILERRAKRQEKRQAFPYSNNLWLPLL